jgi:hypothetical protein
MEDNEKIIHLDALTEIRKKLPACFGSEDKIFAGHPLDEKRAKEVRTIAKKNKITLREVREIALGHLHNIFPDNDYKPTHIGKQMKIIDKFFKNLG